MRFASLIAIVALISVASSTAIIQHWFLDSACSTGEETTTVQSGTCLLDSVDYCGLEWHCQLKDVIADVYGPGDINCTNQPIAHRVFPPNKCVGPLYNDLYLIAAGCS